MAIDGIQVRKWAKQEAKKILAENVQVHEGELKGDEVQFQQETRIQAQQGRLWMTRMQQNNLRAEIGKEIQAIARKANQSPAPIRERDPDKPSREAMRDAESQRWLEEPGHSKVKPMPEPGLQPVPVPPEACDSEAQTTLPPLQPLGSLSSHAVLKQVGAELNPPFTLPMHPVQKESLFPSEPAEMPVYIPEPIPIDQTLVPKVLVEALYFGLIDEIMSPEPVRSTRARAI